MIQKIRRDRTESCHPFIGVTALCFFDVFEETREGGSEHNIQKKLAALAFSFGLFEAVFFVEAVHTSVCLSEFLTACIEWVRIRSDFDTE